MNRNAIHRNSQNIVKKAKFFIFYLVQSATIDNVQKVRKARDVFFDHSQGTCKVQKTDLPVNHSKSTEIWPKLIKKILDTFLMSLFSSVQKRKKQHL